MFRKQIRNDLTTNRKASYSERIEVEVATRWKKHIPRCLEIVLLTYETFAWQKEVENNTKKILFFSYIQTQTKKI